MWGSGYNTYGNALQRDMQPANWLNQNISTGLNNPFGLRFDNYQVGAANPFAGQIYGNTYQPYSGFGNALGGYQYRGW